ncbi:protein OSB1, mitochondrial-like [Juglans microcarpa x Juglans regia]|uniref:protein OSB1, mitochondrial-like n=1 Tax=Juglans microcarpa x Juglans regia TaxID=2249226 RepID=UPI001B7F2C4F|nr:protein OSB1, mitochondrial-like [Juglans microcarpa x Juglans regia]
MSAHRFGGLIRNATRFSLQNSAARPRSPPPTKFFAEDVEGGSEVYGHALKFQRPTTITMTQQLVNSVSFIGSVESPLRIKERVKLGRFGVYTLLSVKASPDSNRKFRILLNMWDEMARMSLEHLKPNDFVYVSGRLGSYTKVLEGVKLKTFYTVTVEELNYVSKSGQGPTRPKVEGSQLGAGVAGLEVHENRLHLWQVFFTNPYEWWDNRKQKDLRQVNLSAPDFKHKDTGEVLWLNPNDPPWIKRQLKLLDTKMAEKGQGDHVGSHSRVSMWVYDEY